MTESSAASACGPTGDIGSCACGCSGDECRCGKPSCLTTHWSHGFGDPADD